MKFLKTFAFMFCYTVADRIAGVIGTYLTDWLMGALNTNSFLGALIYLGIYGTIMGNIFFWVTLFLAQILPTKGTTTFATVWIAASLIYTYITYYGGGSILLFVLALIQFGASWFPLLSRRMILIEKEKEEASKKPQTCFCPYCGKLIELAPFCSYCGSKIKTPGD